MNALNGYDIVARLPSAMPARQPSRDGFRAAFPPEAEWLPPVVGRGRTRAFYL